MDSQALPPIMTFDRATQFLGHHHIKSRRCYADPACIEALAEGTNSDGSPFAEWERLPLRLTPIRDWLGY